MESRSRRGGVGGWGRRVGVVLLLVLGAPGAAEAQWGDILSLEVGDSLRFRLPGALRLDASMQGMRRDTLLVRVDGIAADWPISGYDFVSLERFGDRSPREGLRNGALLGMVAGVFAGAVLGLALDAAAGDGEGEPTERLMRSSLRGAGFGVVVGAIGGGVWGGRRPGRGWISLDLPVR